MSSAPAAVLRLPRVKLRGRPRFRRPTLRMLLVTLVALAPLTGGYLLFRDSSLVAVEQVQISGVRGADAAPVSQALEAAAKRMSTLDFSASALQAAVSDYPVVRSLHVSTSFPHRMTIEVREQLPVAQISANGLGTAVAADGVVLGPTFVSRALPSIPERVAPATGGRVHGDRLHVYLTALGAAPQPLLPLISRIYVGPQGLTLRMRNGLLAYFGDASRAHAKWDSLITVLSNPGSAGASYVDVRVPERPAAGLAHGGVGSGEGAEVSASDPTAAALAESLAKAVDGEPTTPAASGAPTSTSATGPATTTTQTTTEPASAPSSQSPATATSPEAGGEAATSGGG